MTKNFKNLGLVKRMQSPFGLEEDVITFEEKDSFNPKNLVKGYINRRHGKMYGSLYITHVNGKPCPQVVYGAPKMRYPFNVETHQNPDEWDFPKADSVALFEKIDGTNVTSYKYHDDESTYLTYKTRLRPFLGESKFGNFKGMWNEVLDTYPEINDVCWKSPHNLSFELYGKRNKILVDYDIPLDTKLIFMIDQNDNILTPQSCRWKIPKLEPLAILKKVDSEYYIQYQNKLEEALEYDEKTGYIKGKEGTAWYFIKGKNISQVKCKPPTILKLHWEPDVISYESVKTTVINSFENFDKPTVDDVNFLLSEEFSWQMIDKSQIRVEKILKRVTVDKKLQTELAREYEKLGIDINKDKVSVMRHFSILYPRDKAKKVFTLLNAYVNEVRR